MGAVYSSNKFFVRFVVRSAHCSLLVKHTAHFPGRDSLGTFHPGEVTFPLISLFFPIDLSLSCIQCTSHRHYRLALCTGCALVCQGRVGGPGSCVCSCISRSWFASLTHFDSPLYQPTQCTLFDPVCAVPLHARDTTLATPRSHRVRRQVQRCRRLLNGIHFVHTTTFLKKH